MLAPSSNSCHPPHPIKSGCQSLRSSRSADPFAWPWPGRPSPIWATIAAPCLLWIWGSPSVPSVPSLPSVPACRVGDQTWCQSELKGCAPGRFQNDLLQDCILLWYVMHATYRLITICVDSKFCCMHVCNRM